MAYAERFGTVLALTPAGKLGQSVITYENPESAYLAAGVNVPLPGVGNVRYSIIRAGRASAIESGQFKSAGVYVHRRHSYYHVDFIDYTDSYESATTALSRQAERRAKSDLG